MKHKKPKKIANLKDFDLYDDMEQTNKGDKIGKNPETAERARLDSMKAK